MPDHGVTASTTQNCLAGGSDPSVKPLLVVTWSSSFQLCFYISKVTHTTTSIINLNYWIQWEWFHRRRGPGVWIKSYLPSTLRKFHWGSLKVCKENHHDTLYRHLLLFFVCLFYLFITPAFNLHTISFHARDVDQPISGRTPLSEPRRFVTVSGRNLASSVRRHNDGWWCEFVSLLPSRVNRWNKDVWNRSGHSGGNASSTGFLLSLLHSQIVSTRAGRWCRLRPQGRRHFAHQQFPTATVPRRSESLWRRSVIALTIYGQCPIIKK